MNPVTIKLDANVILYDASLLSEISAQWFDHEWWEQQGLLTGTAPGRGTTHFINAPFGPAALRQYLRGGWAARVSQDRYWFSGVSRSRPFREFELLSQMRSDGLRVPRPIAALCSRVGAAYRGALITGLIEQTKALADLLDDPTLDWQNVGAQLRRFHEAGVNHVDLNANNILLSEPDRDLWLLDFDRCQYRRGRAVHGKRNLARLRRSLLKLWPGKPGSLETAWKNLTKGYQC